MRRLLALLIALALSLSLAGCGGSEESASTGTAETEAAAETTEGKTRAGAAQQPDEAQTGFEEIVVFDDEKCLVKITGVDPENDWGYTVNVYLENRLTDENLYFEAGLASVNGIEAGLLFAFGLPAGKNTNKEIQLLDRRLYMPDVGDFTDIELTFAVAPYALSGYVATQESVHIYPYGEENAVKYVRAAQPEDIVLVDNDDASIIVTGFEMDSVWGYTVDLYLVNKTDRELYLGCYVHSINGIEADLNGSQFVRGGHVAFPSMIWSASALEEHGIETVEEIEIQYWLDDPDRPGSGVNETVTLKP